LILYLHLLALVLDSGLGYLRPMEPTIRAITCPCCRQILYALEMNPAGTGNAWKMTADSPAVQNDTEGQFMKCGKCSKRIAIERISRSGVDTWTVSAKQSCDRVLP
jgi:hypothetical protein